MNGSFLIAVVCLINVVASVPTVKKRNISKLIDLANIDLLEDNSMGFPSEKDSNDEDEETAKEDFTQYCYIGDGVYIKEGEQAPAPTGECMAIKCIKATPLAMQISSIDCNWFVPRPGCLRSDYDDSKQYPECCPGEIC